MPLLVPLTVALVVALAATMLWVWAGSIARVRHGMAVAIAVALLAAAGLGLIVLAETTDAVPAWPGWALLIASALALPAGWVALARWAPNQRR
ncbi:hypothetical protein [Agrococcus carbonis]|uniref:Uncharacterized protein n=1 Tax=Agrococcus carbonis TaxID=684552 RepID=A0A1H1MTR5_9MICO|nr:hypothetical protein [Agrococcus carbonis]SDR89982.1 hypothetical protein SAMN04489719_1076 [Agrococcus carbonis]